MAIETDPEEIGDHVLHQEWDACVSTWTYQLFGVFRRDVCSYPRVGRARFRCHDQTLHSKMAGQQWAEMAKLQPVVRPLRAQNHESDGNKVALLEPVGTKSNGKEVGTKAA